MTDTPDDQTGSIPPADERIRAREELQGLKEHWAEREEAFDATAAGSLTGVEGSPLRDAMRRYGENKLAMASTVVVAVMALMSIFAPMVQLAPTVECRGSQVKPDDICYDRKDQGPSADHPFGTTPLGKDLWTLAWKGGRISLAVGFATALTILVIGMIYGAISGYLGGRADNAMMRLLDSLYGLPYLPFAIMFVTVMREKNPGLAPIFYMVPALSIITWFTAARIMRAQVLSLKENEYVEAARSSGAAGHRILSRHIAPNTFGIMIVAIFLEVPNAILGEATLSFLGLGVQPPDTSWGRLAFEGYTYFNTQPHLVWIPALLIAVTVLAAVSMADGLRDALDPRGKRN